MSNLTRAFPSLAFSIVGLGLVSMGAVEAGGLGEATAVEDGLRAAAASGVSLLGDSFVMAAGLLLVSLGVAGAVMRDSLQQLAIVGTMGVTFIAAPTVMQVLLDLGEGAAQATGMTAEGVVAAPETRASLKSEQNSAPDEF